MGRIFSCAQAHSQAGPGRGSRGPLDSGPGRRGRPAAPRGGRAHPVVWENLHGVGERRAKKVTADPRRLQPAAVDGRSDMQAHAQHRQGERQRGRGLRPRDQARPASASCTQARSAGSMSRSTSCRRQRGPCERARARSSCAPASAVARERSVRCHRLPRRLCRWRGHAGARRGRGHRRA